MLEVRELTKRYGAVPALDGLSLTAREGRLLGFLGPNGAGKTTAMRSVLGLVRPDAGVISWRGRPITAEQRLRFGYMPEQRGLYPRMAAGAQLRYLARLHGLDRASADRAAHRWLEELGLGDRVGDAVAQLSHGNQQRVQLAAALVHDPHLLVLDEPFSGLDPLGVEAMSDVLRARAAAGATVLFSSHQLDLVEGLCDDVVIVAGRRATTVAPRSASPAGAHRGGCRGPRCSARTAGSYGCGCRPTSTPSVCSTGSRPREGSSASRCSHPRSRRSSARWWVRASPSSRQVPRR
jgi:ABC-2 type transport system ATP-binding protein